MTAGGAGFRCYHSPASAGKWTEVAVVSVLENQIASQTRRGRVRGGRHSRSQFFAVKKHSFVPWIPVAGRRGAGRLGFRRSKVQLESLILAQNERWRRA